jgi:hypothetical protein
MFTLPRFFDEILGGSKSILAFIPYFTYYSLKGFGLAEYIGFFSPLREELFHFLEFTDTDPVTYVPKHCFSKGSLGWVFCGVLNK